jgi:hypothetical protein
VWGDWQESFDAIDLWEAGALDQERFNTDAVKDAV